MYFTWEKNTATSCLYVYIYSQEAYRIIDDNVQKCLNKLNVTIYPKLLVGYVSNKRETDFPKRIEYTA